jgi:hypothetical protein
MTTNDFFPGCFYKIKANGNHVFNGIIASFKVSRHKKDKKVRLFLGVGPHQYIQVNIENVKYFDSKKIGIEGIGKPLTDEDKACSIITTTRYRYY